MIPTFTAVVGGSQDRARVLRILRVMAELLVDRNWVVCLVILVTSLTTISPTR